MKKALCSTLFAAALVSVWPCDAWAEFELSVSPRRGGQSIQFSASRGESGGPSAGLRNEEVTLAVATDRAAQYRILQTVYQPLTNESGNTLPSGSLFVFSPSTPLGTLRSQLETPISMGQSQIYTSNAGGDSDEFILVFNVRVPEEQPGGIYRTQITFSAEPVNMQQAVSPSTTTLEVRVDIQPKFLIELTGGKGRGLDLGRVTKDRPGAAQEAALNITSNIGTSYRIYQALSEPLVSAEGHALEAEALTFTPRSHAQGNFSAGGAASVPAAPALLYSSNEWGASDELRVEYIFASGMEQKAGVYRGLLTFRVESNSPLVGQEILQMPVTLEIEPIFSLETVFETSDGIRFAAAKAGDARQERRVLLKVHSNLEQAYQVTQIVPYAMSTADGSAMPEGAFRFSVGRTKSGEVRTPASQSVQTGEAVLFVSDPKGTPEEVGVLYTLEAFSQAKAGSYSTQIKYSITTL